MSKEKVEKNLISVENKESEESGEFMKKKRYSNEVNKLWEKSEKKDGGVIKNLPSGINE